MILDLNGNVKTEVKDDTSKGFHISFNSARWTDNAIKSGNKIYYISPERKLVEYDINTKQKKIIRN